MGGYMGLGLQKWIYSRDPQKKMFKKERLKSFTALPKYSRTFILKPSIKENKKLNGLLTVVFSFLILSVFTFNHFVDYSNKQSQRIIKITNFKNLEAFNFLVNSGENRLRTNQIKMAYSEFKLAYNINSENKELNQLMIETLSILCSNDNKYCDELDAILDVF
ncbi:hypothetical protein [Algibacter sp. L1A34]|uniref:hypothetical protein n=1 Tax=Algibacter sp. L1A34 TaxID=2686365 RepID=UPI00131C42E9|nr:hypothetical protein [Algibacter sp. L1A34]